MKKYIKNWYIFHLIWSKNLKRVILQLTVWDISVCCLV